MAEALRLMESLAGFLADADAAELPAEALAGGLQGMEWVGAVLAAAQGRFAVAFDAKDGHLADGQKTAGTWLVNKLRVTRAQAAQYKALQALARDHQVLWTGLRAKAVSRSLALQLALWTRAIPKEFRPQAEEILVAAALAGASQRDLAAICAEIKHRTAPPDPDGPDPRLDRGLSLDTTFEGAGLLRGDLTPECAAMVAAVLVPVVVGDIDPGAIEQLIICCVEYDRIRGHAHDGADADHGPDADGSADPRDAGQPAGTAAEVLAMLEHQILATVIQIVSGPGGVASFLRRHLLGKGLNGPSLPLDVGQP